MPMKAREMIKLLKKNGFIEDRQNGSHLIMKKPGHQSVPVPIHSGDLKPGTERSILKQAGLR